MSCDLDKYGLITVKDNQVVGQIQLPEQKAVTIYDVSITTSDTDSELQYPSVWIEKSAQDLLFEPAFSDFEDSDIFGLMQLVNDVKARVLTTINGKITPERNRKKTFFQSENFG
jgi:hypothetical protein